MSVEDEVVCSNLATTHRTDSCGALYKQRTTTREISHTVHPGWENDVITSVLIIATRSKSLTKQEVFTGIAYVVT